MLKPTVRSLSVLFVFLLMTSYTAWAQTTPLAHKTDSVARLALRYITENKPDSIYQLMDASFKKRYTVDSWRQHFEEGLKDMLPFTKVTFISSILGVNSYRLDGKEPMLYTMSLDTLGKLRLSISPYPAQPGQKMIGNETDAQKKQRLQWWEDARFGMFIHWGLYSQAARHEWVKNIEHMTNEQYQKYFDQFDPDQFDPHKWARAAKAAGMKYVVLTTKHHEGFCLFDSKYTDYKATNTKAHRDLVKEYVQAMREEGLKVGFYYSLLDWHHPDYTMDDAHPLTQTDTSAANYQRLNKGRDMAKYRQYLRNQITELLTNYGKIDVLWLDWSWDKGAKNGKGADDWGSVELLKLVRKLQPGIIVNNRLGLYDYKDGGDFQTPEQVNTNALAAYRGTTWETCQTFSGSWGYYRDENSWKTHRQLLDLLITSVSNGGNLILNVGPTARGEFDYRATNALDSLAYWMHANSKAIYNCTYAPASLQVPDGTRLTYNPTTRKLYIHLFEYPKGKLVLPGYNGKIKYAQFVNDSSELLFKVSDSNAQDLVLTLPGKKPPYDIPVIELSL